MSNDNPDNRNQDEIDEERYHRDNFEPDVDDDGIPLNPRPWTFRRLLQELNDFAIKQPSYLDKIVEIQVACGYTALDCEYIFELSTSDDNLSLLTQGALEVWNRGDPPCEYCHTKICSEDAPICEEAVKEQKAWDAKYPNGLPYDEESFNEEIVDE